jgi:hypothetical protein
VVVEVFPDGREGGIEMLLYCWAGDIHLGRDVVEAEAVLCSEEENRSLLCGQAVDGGLCRLVILLVEKFLLGGNRVGSYTWIEAMGECPEGLFSF